MYEGWEIRARKGKISKAKESEVWCRLKACFKGEDWDFFENDHRHIISSMLYRFEIKVFFDGVEYGNKEDRDMKTYGIILRSEVFGIKACEEKAHRRLFKRAMGRIPWRKQGFLLEDGGRKPISKIKMLRIG